MACWSSVISKIAKPLGGDDGGGRSSPEHPRLILHTPRDSMSHKDNLLRRCMHKRASSLSAIHVVILHLFATHILRKQTMHTPYLVDAKHIKYPTASFTMAKVTERIRMYIYIHTYKLPANHTSNM